MPQNIPYRDPREQFTPEAAGLPGSPVTIQGGGGFGPEGAYQAGTQTAYVPAAGQPIYGQGVNPQAASYLQNVGGQDEQLNAAYKEQYIADKKAKRANLEQEYGKDFADYYDLLRSGPNPLPINDAKKEAWAYKMKREDSAAKLELARTNQSGKGGNIKYAGEYFNPDTGQRVLGGITDAGVINATTGEPLTGNWHRLGAQVHQPAAGERKAMSDFYTLQDKVQTIEDMFSANPGLVGGGGITGIAGQYLNEDTAYFRSTVDDIKDSLLRARSGAQINEQEYKRLARFLPTYYGTDEKFKGQLRRFKDELNTVLKNKQRVFGENLVGVPALSGGAPQQQATPQPQPTQPAGGEEPYPAPAGQKWQHNKDKSQWRLVPAQ